MPYAASLSTSLDTVSAVDSACHKVLETLRGQSPDLVFLFMSHDHRPEFDSAVSRVQESLGCKVLLGCAAESVAGAALEIEGDPAVSLWAAQLPGATLQPFQLRFRSTADGLVCDGFPELPPEEAEHVRAVFLLGEPFSCAVDFIIEQLADMAPGAPLLGGMASGGHGRGQNYLFYQGETVDQGAVGVIVRGGPKIKSIVSQGCRQIGHTYVVTKSERNMIVELGGKPAMERLQETWQDISGDDQRLVQHGLHVGIVMNEYKDKFHSGDFLVTNVMGVDQETGAIAVGALVRTGQTIQFHVRDAHSADEELRHMLVRETQNESIDAALLFTCNGRGTRLFSEPNHDAAAVQAACGPLPLAGFFAQGELGPVGSKNYIHGFTASVVLFHDQA
jgi:small ligand-binding sensory domain FIST